MTRLVSAAEVNALGAGGGLSDANLEAIIDREEAELIRRFGAHTGSRAEIIQGGGVNIFTRRPISSITSITQVMYLGDTATTTLTTDDYYPWLLEGRLQHLWGLWGPAVTVTYTPVDDTELRKAVLIELVRVGVSQDTGQAVSGLGYSISGSKGAGDWNIQRERIYARLAGPGDR